RTRFRRRREGLGAAQRVASTTASYEHLIPGRRDDDDHREPDRLITGVAVAVVQAAGKPGALAGRDRVLIAADRDRQHAGVDPHHLAGTRYVRLAAERLAGHDLPVPQFGCPGHVGGAQNRTDSAGLALPYNA